MCMYIYVYMYIHITIYEDTLGSAEQEPKVLYSCAFKTTPNITINAYVCIHTYTYTYIYVIL